MRTRLFLLIGLVVSVTPATGEANAPTAAPAVKKAKVTSTQSKADAAKSQRDYFVDQKASNLDGYLCRCTNDKYPNGIGVLQFTNPAPYNGFYFKGLTCGVWGGHTDVGGLVKFTCDDFESLGPQQP